MKLQQEANRKILELADKAQTEAIRLSILCIILAGIAHEVPFTNDLPYRYSVKSVNDSLTSSNS